MNINEEYEILINEYNEVKEKITELENDNTVKEYLKYKDELNKLSLKLGGTREVLNYLKYKKCHHILVITKATRDGRRTYKDYGCIKCMLDTRVQDKKNLSIDEEYMKNYLSLESISNNSIKTDINYSNLELLNKIYERIINIYPNITDEELIKYLNHSIESIIFSDNKAKKLNRNRRLNNK